MSKEVSVIASCTDYFSSTTLEFYNSSLINNTVDNRLLYEARMKERKRWQDPALVGLVDGLSETDLDHILALAQIWSVYKTIAPCLAEEIDSDIVQQMFIVHDSGEVYTKDWPAVGALRESKRVQEIKAKESQFVERLIRQYVAPAEKDHVRNIYSRYEAASRPKDGITYPPDKEALVANFIDKAHSATRTSMEYIYHPSKRELITHDLKLRHMQAIEKMLNFVPPLLLLLSPQAGSEFVMIVDDELSRVADNGFGSELGDLLKIDKFSGLQYLLQ